MLKVLLVVFFIFLFIGLYIKHLFDKYIPPIEEEEVEEAVDDEGSVIEKTSESEEGEEANEGVTELPSEQEE